MGSWDIMWPFSENFPELRSEDVDGKTFDYIIVGGGTAGCVLASRLSEDPTASVLVIERGMVNNDWKSRVPLLSLNYLMTDSPAIKDRYSDPIAARGGYKLQLVSGRNLGGTSRINSTLSTRGAPGAYNDWAESLGLTDWSWDKVEPYFRSLETALSAPDDPSRGHDGPFHLRLVPEAHKWFSYLEKPCQTLGLPVCRDVNSSQAPAQGYFNLDTAIDLRGERISAFSAFLNECIANQRKPHLSICIGTVATKLELDGRKGTVSGVHIRSAGGTAPDHYVKARREVIICSGAFGTPQLLMLSGIGPKDELNKHGISQVRDLPVGRNLKDHTCFVIMLEVTAWESVLGIFNAFRAFWMLIVYLVWGLGVFAHGLSPRAIFMRTACIDDECKIKSKDDDGADNMDATKPENVPDVEVMMVASSAIDRIITGKNIISFLSALIQPTSVGHLELVSTNPEDNMKAVYPYFTDPQDLITSRKAARFSMRLAQEFLQNSDYPYPASMFMAPSINKEASPPDISEASTKTVAPLSASEKTWDTVTDEEIDEYVLALGITGLHFACTCRMSLDPTVGVVDEKLRVHGFSNLRVADASALPKIPPAHTMLPSMMLGARCADFIKAELKEKKDL